jgi:hypothetical protein
MGLPDTASDKFSVRRNLSLVRFQIFTAASMKTAVFWDVVPCSLAETDLRFGAMRSDDVGSKNL